MHVNAKGALRHSYTVHRWMAPDIQERGIDLLTSIWHVMDSPGKAGEVGAPALPTYERHMIALADGLWD